MLYVVSRISIGINNHTFHSVQRGVETFLRSPAKVCHPNLWPPALRPRDSNLWHSACLRVWGRTTLPPFKSWREMFLERPRVRFDGSSTRCNDRQNAKGFPLSTLAGHTPEGHAAQHVFFVLRGLHQQGIVRPPGRGVPRRLLQGLAQCNVLQVGPSGLCVPRNKTSYHFLWRLRSWRFRWVV